MNTFKLDGLPDITFTVQRGPDEDDGPEIPSNWLQFTGINDKTGEIVFSMGGAGP